MLDTFLDELNEKMNKTVEALKKELLSVRTGRANAAAAAPVTSPES